MLGAVEVTNTPIAVGIIIGGICLFVMLIIVNIVQTLNPPKCRYCGEKPVVKPGATGIPEGNYCEDHLLEKDRK